MKRLLCTALLIALVVPLAAQSPAGWQVRADRSTNPTDPDGAGEIRFTTIPGGFRAVNPTAAIFWNPANTASGAFTLRGTFKLNEPSGHTNFYGLFIGGRALEGAEQSYLYFMVAQDGSYLVRKRAGDRMPDPNATPGGRRMGGAPGMDLVQTPAGGQGMPGGGRMGGRGRGGPQAITENVARGTHDAVQKPGADGTSTNALEVRVSATTIDFAVNNTVVHSMPKGETVTDGIYGIRVNHLLNVDVTNFGVAR
jgi:hypothetical protein